MKTIKILFVLALVVLFFTTCKKEDNNDEETIQVFGSEFVPYVFPDNEKIVGIDADIAAEAMLKAGVDMEMSMADTWQEAYNAILSGPNKALLSTTYIPERTDLFKWAGPTSKGMYAIFENGESNFVFPLSIEECKELPSIAVVTDWWETTTLEDMGFTNLVYYETYSEALDAFMNSEIRFIASDFYHLVSALPSGYYLENVHVVTSYRTVYYYIAFSKDVSDAAVNSVQTEIESMIKNKNTVSIVRKYIPFMPENYISGTIQLYTENSPPTSFEYGHGTSAEVRGSSIDIVNEIMVRTGYVNSINLTLWNNAYAIVQYLPNSALFNTARTPERENMFQWVGPISSSRTYFYTLASSGLTIETLEQAKALESIATPNGWFTHDFLINNNFQNIVATSRTSMEAFDQLISGEVQALLMTDLDVKWLADISEVPLSNLTQHMEALNFKDYIAFSLSTPATTVLQWQDHLDAMKADGTFETIWNRWFEEVPMP
ncbi:MAG: transporter substrate-binding domain-containing protein [Bacteroidia bacterium]|nr:transporter substrate-binding domain-containing protein [Bacteroidales bacterium]MDD3011349.1 transporter substrate-binding domain-containing protein [Bacteroidales bacterium]NCD41272.1 transporter substrate-binding domain-containing protein [Bacteroidia bacterium]HPE87641.1 transporter substrate-binding domain-containing protein [Bacteroidales bacterium]